MTPSETTGHTVRNHDISTGTRSLAEIQGEARRAGLATSSRRTSTRWTPGGGRTTTSPSARSTCGQPAAARAAGAEHIKPRLLGHWGTSPGLSFIYAHVVAADPADRPGDDLPRRPRSRWSGAGRGRLPGGHLHARSTRDVTQDEDGHAAAVPAVLHARRHSQPRVGDHARVDPRGRRARVRPGARVRCGDGQPGSDRARGRRGR